MVFYNIESPDRMPAAESEDKAFWVSFEVFEFFTPVLNFVVKNLD
jgi:hypothetical protein